MLPVINTFLTLLSGFHLSSLKYFLQSWKQQQLPMVLYPLTSFKVQYPFPPALVFLDWRHPFKCLPAVHPLLLIASPVHLWLSLFCVMFLKCHYQNSTWYSRCETEGATLTSVHMIEDAGRVKKDNGISWQNCDLSLFLNCTLCYFDNLKR